MNTTTKSNSKEFIEIPSNSTMAKDITSYKKNNAERTPSWAKT